MRLITQESTTKKSMPKRLVLGFAALASAAVIGTAGMAGATAGKPSKAQCQAAGYSNYGQCVKDWAHNKPRPGNGYGGGNNNRVNTEVDLEVNGDDNVINIVINYIFG